jgi:hypothetical protein
MVREVFWLVKVYPLVVLLLALRSGWLRDGSKHGFGLESLWPCKIRRFESNSAKPLGASPR